MDPRPLIYTASWNGPRMKRLTFHSKRGGSAMEVTTIGIDLAKSVFAVSCADRRGKVVMRKQLRRGQVLELMGKLEPCVVGLEACGGAHHWARAIGRLGHEVRLMSPALVRPYRTGPNKHDRNDADAICEAVGRPS